MDTSETYIKMCEKAKEIQTEITTPHYHQFHMGDWYMSLPEICVGCVGIGDAFYFSDLHKKNMPIKFIWLPRQDQLQEMMCEWSGVKTNPGWSILHALDRWLSKNLRGDMHYWSTEQLWLAFVMKEKYNKVWTGKDWVSE